MGRLCTAKSRSARGVVCGVRMGVAGGGVGTRGEGVVSRGGNVSVADGGGARWKD